MFEPWTTGNIPGQRVATLIAPRAAGKGIKMAKNPLLIVGGLSMTAKAGEKMLIDYVVEMAKELPVVATANSLKGFTEKNITPAAYMGLVEIVDRLKDPEWGVNGKPHDLVIFAGIHYYLASQGLSTLKHFAPHLKTLTLCNMAHPNANWSFPNMSTDEWGRALDELLEEIKGGNNGR